MPGLIIEQTAVRRGHKNRSPFSVKTKNLRYLVLVLLIIKQLRNKRKCYLPGGGGVSFPVVDHSHGQNHLPDQICSPETLEVVV